MLVLDSASNICKCLNIRESNQMCAWDGTQTALVPSISTRPFTAGASVFKWMLVGQMAGSHREAAQQRATPSAGPPGFLWEWKKSPNPSHLTSKFGLRDSQSRVWWKLPECACLKHLRSLRSDDLLIRDGVWGFHDLFFNGIMRWRLLWVDLGCEPTA